jgi:hypothetical protein
MTGGTIRTELSIMLIIAPVTGVTILRCTFEDSILMATRTRYIYMRAGQFEGRQIMVEGCALQG